MATIIEYASKNTILYFWQKIKALLNNKVDKADGMGLSHNDLTDELVTKINNAGDSSFTGAYGDLTGKPKINNVELGAANSLSDLGIQPAGNYPTTTEVETMISDLVDSAPAALDTLKELSAALGDDPNFATTIATQMGNKANTSDFVEITNAEIDTILAT